MLHVLQVLTVVWIGPNVLRVACLHFISSNMHYYGDVEAANVIQQTQVLNRWWLLPAQLFCANFGSTHGIHHLVPNDPFYVRQLTAKVAHQERREQGVRFNDLRTFAGQTASPRRPHRPHLFGAAGGSPPKDEQLLMPHSSWGYEALRIVVKHTTREPSHDNDSC